MKRRSYFTKKVLSDVVSAVNKTGDRKVSTYFFSRRFIGGCGYHPELREHALMADELSAHIKKPMKW